jgi:hypothetical protein
VGWLVVGVLVVVFWFFLFNYYCFFAILNPQTPPFAHAPNTAHSQVRRPTCCERRLPASRQTRM